MKGRVLIVAGSDSGGGAGIQADIKAVTAMGGFAATAITALTAQNTMGVHGVVPVDPAFIAQQIEVVLADIGADAVKTGMLHSAEVIDTVVASLKKHAPGVPLVVDPVIVAKGGHHLLLREAETALRERLLIDLLVHDGKVDRFEDARIASRHTHGTGCTLASATAAGLAQKMSLSDAFARARAYVRKAIETAPGYGQGHGPLNHAVTVRGD